MLYVSRFANPELRTGKYTAVRISVGAPKWPLGYALAGSIEELMPYGLLSIEDKELYQRRYIERLDRFGIDVIQRRIDSFGFDKPVVLLCYEDVRDPSQWCHRTMFAQWLLHQTGEAADELADPSTPRLKSDKQQEGARKTATSNLAKMAKAAREAEERIKERQAEDAQISMFDRRYF